MMAETRSQRTGRKPFKLQINKHLLRTTNKHTGNAPKAELEPVEQNITLILPSVPVFLLWHVWPFGDFNFTQEF